MFVWFGCVGIGIFGVGVFFVDFGDGFVVLW